MQKGILRLSNTPTITTALARLFPGINALIAMGTVALILLGQDVVSGSSPDSDQLKAIKIGHLISRFGPFVAEGEYAAMGARLALEEANVLAGFFGKRFTLLNESISEPGMAEQKVIKLIQENKVTAIVGHVDSVTSLNISEVTQKHGVPFFNCDSIAGNLRDGDCHRYTFHIEANAAMYVSAVGQWLIHKKNLTQWFFLTDKSTKNKLIYETARTYLMKENGEESGIEVVPAGKSNYRVTLNKLKRADPEVVFIIMNDEDQINFLKQYKKRNLPYQVVSAHLDIANLWNEDTVSLTGVWPTIWYHELVRYSARELNSRFFKKYQKPMDSAAWANWAAVKMLGEAVIRTESTDGYTLIKYLESNPPFDGHKGLALTFRSWNHQLRQPMHLVTPRTIPGDRPWDILEVVTPVPLREMKTDGDPLDTLGTSQSESRCQFESL